MRVDHHRRVRDEAPIFGLRLPRLLANRGPDVAQKNRKRAAISATPCLFWRARRDSDPRPPWFVVRSFTANALFSLMFRGRPLQDPCSNVLDREELIPARFPHASNIAEAKAIALKGAEQKL